MGLNTRNGHNILSLKVRSFGAWTKRETVFLCVVRSVAMKHRRSFGGGGGGAADN